MKRVKLDDITLDLNFYRKKECSEIGSSARYLSWLVRDILEGITYFTEGRAMSHLEFSLGLNSNQRTSYHCLTILKNS